MVNVHIEKISKDIDDMSYAHDGDAAFDLRSAEDKIIKAGEQSIIKTGVKMAIPNNHVGLIWDRSGLAAKHELTCLAGVIDSSYRGEVGVVLKNLSKNDFTVEKNMRIAQMLIQPVVSAKLNHVDSLDNTQRGEGGWGSSGLK